jgi:amphi-Trp domain-containing protein
MSSEIKIKRRDVLSAQQVADLFRRLAEQIEARHSFTLDGLPITVAKQVRVRQEFRKEGCEQTYSLKLTWDEQFDDQPGLGDDESEFMKGSREEPVENEEDLPDPGVPPLDLPGPEDRPRMGERE